MAIRKSGISRIPSGNTSARPASPILGDTYYNGQIEALEIYNGTAWKVIKSEGFPPDVPTIESVTDSSTSSVYSSTAGTLTVVFVPSATGGTATQYNAYTTTGGHSGFTTVGSTVVISGLTPGTAYTVYGNAQNGSGTSTNTANASPVFDVVPLAYFGTPTIVFSEPYHGIIEPDRSQLSSHTVGKSEIEFKVLSVRITAIQSGHGIFHKWDLSLSNRFFTISRLCNLGH